MTATTTDLLLDYPARYFAAWNQRDLDAALTVVAETVYWQDPSLSAPITDHQGAAGFPDLEFIAVGEPPADPANNRVTQEWRLIGTHTGQGFPPGVPATGNAFDVAGMDVWQVDADGCAVAVHAYGSPLALLTQLGLA
ncbi:ester cyclase [Mycolicibacterium septicum]|uniref:ester cyclase n=1 Tax=Mycolicibacterium septicum TaxID=98668 RepID=UPI00235F8A8B|nr:nuclear transport factor 2 family protein [Mycolicibacterium septicum]